MRLDAQTLRIGVRRIGGSEEPIPDTETDAEVAVDRTGGRMDVVPHVHFRSVDHVLEPSAAPAKVRVRPMAEHGRTHGTSKEHFGPKTQERRRHVEHGLIQEKLEGVEPPVAEPVEVFRRMMHFMEFPEHRHAVQEIVHSPLDEILH